LTARAGVAKMDVVSANIRAPPENIYNDGTQLKQSTGSFVWKGNTLVYCEE
jgi:hypothetical protein